MHLSFGDIRFDCAYASRLLIDINFVTVIAYVNSKV